MNGTLTRAVKSIATPKPKNNTGNYGSYEGRCVICGGAGVSDAYYCRECCQEERVRV